MSKATKLQKEIVDWLTAMEFYAVNIIAGSKAGTHDVHACIRGWFVSIEVKFGRDTEKALQRTKAKRIINAGGKYVLAKRLEDVINFVEHLEDRSSNTDSIDGWDPDLPSPLVVRDD